MHPRTVVEIAPCANGEPPAEAIRAAYRASEYGLVVLVLRGVVASAVDRILDPLVAALRLDIPGVLYVDADDEPTVAQAVRDAGPVYAVTHHLYSLAKSLEPAESTIHPVLTSSDELARILQEIGPGDARAVQEQSCAFLRVVGGPLKNTSRTVSFRQKQVPSEADRARMRTYSGSISPSATQEEKRTIHVRRRRPLVHPLRDHEAVSERVAEQSGESGRAG
jgi:hypothetical protein